MLGQSEKNTPGLSDARFDERFLSLVLTTGAPNSIVVCTEDDCARAGVAFERCATARVAWIELWRESKGRPWILCFGNITLAEASLHRFLHSNPDPLRALFTRDHHRRFLRWVEKQGLQISTNPVG